MERIIQYQASGSGDVFLKARSVDAIDWAQIVSITPYGDVTICSFTFDDELLLTVKSKMRRRRHGGFDR